MIEMMDVTEVGFLNEATHEKSLERILRASSSNGVSRSAISTLAVLTALAHGGTSVTGASVPVANLDELSSLKLISRRGDLIKLV